MAQGTLEVCLSPVLLEPYDVQGKRVVVIDVLRATTTICTALHHGAESVIPVMDKKACLAYSGRGFLLAAERKGMKVEGFQFGNSPLEYTPNVVSGKTLVLTTTNGTRAIRELKEAKQVLAGAFVNLTALTDFLASSYDDTLLLCSGWKGRVNLEDTLFAGAVAERLDGPFELIGDESLVAKALYRQHQGNLYGIISQSSHYKRLARLGTRKDIEYSMTPDRAPVVPVLKENAFVIA